MFIFVLLTLFAEWIWVDASQEEISMGLEFTSSKVVFLDLDGDGDKDLLRSSSEGVKAFENVAQAQSDALWEPNDNLALGIDWIPRTSDEFSLGAGDLDGNGTEEVVIADHSGISTYAKDDGTWVKDTTFFDNLHEDSMPFHPDFADVDEDGDLDMLGGWENEDHYYLLTMWWNTGTPQNPQWQFDTTYFVTSEFQEQVDMIRFACWIGWNSDDIKDVVFVRWYYDHDWNDVDVLINQGSGSAPEWERETAHAMTILDDIAVLDWNIDDIVLVDYSMHPEGYQYVPGEASGDSVVRDFDHPYFWGGLYARYPAVTDVNSDGIPELALMQQEYHWDFGILPKEYFIPHLKTYSLSDDYKLWQRDSEVEFPSLEPPDTNPYLICPAHSQYVDFGDDGLIDYVLNLDGEVALYRNQGVPEEPDWVKDEDALSDLPDLFPSCFLDIDGDGDNDVIGELISDMEDSTVVAFINIASDDEPIYEYHNDFITGLPSSGITFLTPGDITDNELYLPDLAVNTGYQGLVAYFNSGQANPRWHKHEEVFKSLGVNGNPALCDADGDGDLDLYLVTGGRLHYYCNESTGGITETPPTYLPRVSITYIGREVEVSLTVAQSDGEVKFLLYNSAGQRVMASSQKPRDGEVRFRISQQPGVYFYRTSTKELKITGKVVLY